MLGKTNSGMTFIEGSLWHIGYQMSNATVMRYMVLHKLRLRS